VSAGRVALIVLGSIGALLGLALVVGGGFLLWADRTQREDGYLTTPTERFATPTYALTRTRLEVDADGPDWLWNDNWFGKVRVRGESAAGGKLLFIGIGPEAAVADTSGASRTRTSRTSNSIRSASNTVPSQEARRKGRRRRSTSGRSPHPAWEHKR
jgi:hypothetical protein